MTIDQIVTIAQALSVLGYVVFMERRVTRMETHVERLLESLQ